MKKPDAVLHMMLYGLVYGFLLATLFTWVGAMTDIFGGSSYSFFEDVYYTLLAGFMTGGVPGVAIGFIEGFVIRHMTRERVLPLDAQQLRQSRKRVFIVIGILTSMMMGLMLIPAYRELIDSLSDFLFLTLPLPIGVTAALYTTYRYLLKLDRWTNIGKVKNEHKPKNQLAYGDAPDDLLVEETEFKQDNSRTVQG